MHTDLIKAVHMCAIHYMQHCLAGSLSVSDLQYHKSTTKHSKVRESHCNCLMGIRAPVLLFLMSSPPTDFMAD